MGALSTFLKSAWDHIPFCKDQGIEHLCGAGAGGTSVQRLSFTMEGTGVINFAALDMPNMEDDDYQVLVQNQTDAADEALISAKAVTGFTITGPDVNDVLDIVIFGTLSGQRK